MDEKSERTLIEGAAVEAKAAARYLAALREAGVPDATAQVLTSCWISAQAYRAGMGDQAAIQMRHFRPGGGE